MQAREAHAPFIFNLQSSISIVTATATATAAASKLAGAAGGSGSGSGNNQVQSEEDDEELSAIGDCGVVTFFAMGFSTVAVGGLVGFTAQCISNSIQKIPLSRRKLKVNT
jgi:hypothetical protein